MLSVKNLCKEFPTPTQPLSVLKSVDLEMNAGSNLAIVGPSGCGKSTLLHIVGTLDSPSSGSITLNKVDPFALSQNELADYRNQNIGFVFQEHYLLPQLSAIENVMVPALAKGAASNEIKERAGNLLDQVGLKDRFGHLPSEMSGGERQRVAIARAMILNPAILLADEPTGNLDQDTATRIGTLLLDLQKNEGTMLICVTHSRELASTFEITRQLDRGKLVDLASSGA